MCSGRPSLAQHSFEKRTFEEEFLSARKKLSSCGKSKGGKSRIIAIGDYGTERQRHRDTETLKHRYSVNVVKSYQKRPKRRRSAQDAPGSAQERPGSAQKENLPLVQGKGQGTSQKAPIATTRNESTLADSICEGRRGLSGRRRRRRRLRDLALLLERHNREAPVAIGANRRIR